jgi:hypothetical protein
MLVTLVLASPAVLPGVATERTEIGLEELFPGATFDPAIPTPEAFTGVAPGSRPLRHDEIVRYFETLADASPRATLRTHAVSHEGRKLVHLIITDESSAAGLDAFRDEHAARVDPRERPPAEDKAALGDAKAVAWMGYAIHGDELSSADAAVALAYWLVAGEDDRARRLRRDLVVIVDPMENPDGRDRFLAQTEAFAHARPNPDPEDITHTTVWPWGRGNHYLFDLNRDWFNMTQPETGRAEVIASWNPQLMVDSHEMGSDDTYLFSPARHPFNPFLPPSQNPWLDRFAADQARALDARGYAYYTREWNEEFFPGYGSSWSVYLGAVGILYEMSSTEGTPVQQRAGTVRTYPQAVEHHVASSVSNLETLVENRVEILLDYVADRRSAIRDGEQGDIRAFIFPPGPRPARTEALVALLRRQGIEVMRLAEPVKARGLHDIRTGEDADRELPAGTWMVRLDQPAARLARVLLDPHVPMDADFLREEREYIEREKGSRLYETTAWSLPLARGVEAWWTGTLPGGKWEEASPGSPRGSVGGSAAVHAYLIDGGSDRSVGALADLLQRGLAVRIAAKPFTVAGRSYQRGAIQVKREGNPDDLATQLTEVAKRWNVDVFATPTAKAQQGPDLGGREFDPLVAPRVGVWTAMPVSPSDYGAIWHLLDRGVDLRFTALDLGRFAQTDLRRYNVLVFPPARRSWGGDGGAHGGYRAALGKNGVERLRSWIEAGGTAIGIGSGAEFLADRELELTKTRLRRQALDRFAPVVLGASARQVVQGGRLRATGLRANDEEDDSEAAAGSPYDVAPILGPGALPFAEGADLGTPASTDPVSLEKWIVPLLPSGETKPTAEAIESADERLRQFKPHGTFLRVDLDDDLWLSWGLPSEITAWVDAADTLVAESPVRVAARFPDVERLHLGGLLWPEAAGRLSGTAYATRESVGSGQVILYLDNPVFRGWMHDTARHFLNAVIYGPGLGTSWPAPW